MNVKVRVGASDCAFRSHFGAAHTGRRDDLVTGSFEIATPPWVFGLARHVETAAGVVAGLVRGFFASVVGVAAAPELLFLDAITQSAPS